ncbi:MarR family winged helix-turn-helix transcriptional regulator [Kineosporia succinea]|uniref:DNA-binding MarR family transcriptional regulator n=1 Tax=Kineosporia succinea TaxID=84632 RepID=A0ABT9PB91_9ACTN|nr:MarR family transcriptional regulator [Kineosporia succinea]MDP9829295.1 DNA-binding MarR family transcriptional regulator [Kineosporia succinea]
MDEIPDRLASRPTWLIGQLTLHGRRLLAEGWAEAGVKGYHYRLLATLEEFGPASQAQLGRRSRMDRSDVVAAVNALEELGFVHKTPDPDHGRRNRVMLTAAGAAQLRRLDPVVDRVQDELLGPLSAAERATLVRLLGQALRHHEPGEGE